MTDEKKSPKHTNDELKQYQALPLELKIKLSERRIRDWVREYGTDGVYVSFSGGKDSTVLLHMVRNLYPDIPAVFCDTGLEYPEIKEFVKTQENVVILRPKMNFRKVIEKYGYPLISKTVSHNVSIAKRNPNGNVVKNCFTPKKRGQFAMFKWSPLISLPINFSEKCCDNMKKYPVHKYIKDTGQVSIVGTMAAESILRKNDWLVNGCNSFDKKRPQSKPLSFWTEQDILQYIKQFNIPYSAAYGDIVYETDPNQLRLDDYTNQSLGIEPLTTTGCNRTGCIFCGFGCHLERGETRFQRLKRTHPKLYNYCIGGGEFGDDGIWKPSDKGLGFGYVFDEVNKIYGDDFIRYK